MKLIKHTNLIYEYTNFISSNECEEISEWLQPKLESYKTKLGKIKNRIRNNTALNVTYLSPKDINLFLYKKSHDIIQVGYRKYLDDNKFLNYITRNTKHNKEELTGLLYYRSYDISDYYDWHIDYSGNLDEQLLFSFILYLNDDFEGGNTLFINDRLKIVPKSGTLLCFPCDLHHAHKSTKILIGQKNILWSCLSTKINN